MTRVLHSGRWLRRVSVAGDSMAPTLCAGDRLLVVATGRYRSGDVVAVRDPRHPERVIVKRIATADDSAAQYLVLGDQSDNSTDSRHFGPVGRADVLGRVVYRYAPSERVGRIRR